MSNPRINLIFKGNNDGKKNQISDAIENVKSQQMEKMWDNVFNSIKIPPIPSATSSLSTKEALSSRIDTIVGKYFSAVAVGACIGAAITVGIIFGAAASSTLISSLKYHNKRWSLFDFFGAKATNSSVSNSVLVILSQPDIKKIQNIGSKEQCRSCIIDLAENLAKNNLGWQSVRKITIYMVSEKCEVDDFKSVWNQYHTENSDNAINQYEKIMLLIIFVQRLEMEDAVVQLETLAC